MIKRLNIIIVLVLVFAVPNISTAFRNNFAKSLCDFPFGEYGTFEVSYDQQVYHLDYYNWSKPNGGILFQLWLGFFPSVEERDSLVDGIKRITYRNRTTGSTHIITKADKYLYTGTPSAGFDIWFGHESKVIGEWQIIVQYKFSWYFGYFTITQEMIDQIPPIAVNPKVRYPSEVSDLGDHYFDIVAQTTNGDQYRLRLSDEDGNLVTNDTMEIIDGTVCHTYPVELMGMSARIETRLNFTDWPILGSGDSCNAYGMNPGGYSRSRIFFETTNID